jgi:hypothetical protein
MIHPDDATIERFAIGALEGEEDFVAHLVGCAECSAKLQREAVVELSLLEVREARGEQPPLATAVPEAERPSISRFRRPAVIAGFGALAVAAATLLYVGRGARPLDPTAAGASGTVAAVPVVSCPDGPRQASCIAKANLEGSYVEYPRDPNLLGLGKTPGLTISLSLVGTPNPPLPGIEEVVESLREPIAQCIDTHLGASRETSMAMFSFTTVVEAGGEVSTTSRVRSALKMRGTGEVPPVVGKVMPCIASTMERTKFSSNGKRTVIEIAVRYVWRA